MMDTGNDVFAILVLMILVGFYCLPGIVASHRHHHNKVAIWLTTLLFGWTGAGWGIALIWASTAVKHEEQYLVVHDEEDEPACR